MKRPPERDSNTRDLQNVANADQHGGGPTLAGAEASEERAGSSIHLIRENGLADVDQSVGNDDFEGLGEQRRDAPRSTERWRVHPREAVCMRQPSLTPALTAKARLQCSCASDDTPH